MFELVFSSLDPSELAVYTINRSEVLPSEYLKNSFADDDSSRRALIGRVSDEIQNEKNKVIRAKLSLAYLDEYRV